MNNRVVRTLVAAGSFAMFVASGTEKINAQGTEAVTLTANDGSFTAMGMLLDVTENEFIVESPTIGVVRLDRDMVTCSGTSCPQDVTWDPKFGIHGSRTVGTTLIPNLLEGYAESLGGRMEIEETGDPSARIVRVFTSDGQLRAEIDLQTRGSGSAITGLLGGEAVIGLTDRRFNSGDLEKMTAAGQADLRDTENEIVLGVDGIVVITNPANPVRDLSSEEVSRIYSGEITNWLELGGGDVPISVQTYGEGSGDRSVLLNGLVRPFGRDETANVTRWEAYQDLVDAVAAERGAIGYVGRWLAATNDVNMMPIREVCGLQSEPSDFRMKIEGYSLSRRLYAYKLPGDLHPEAKRFLDWTLTRPAQPYIKESHFIDRDLERMRLEDMGQALIHTAAVEPDFSGRQYSEMMRELRGADRLSISFRFSSGSSRLDSESVRNVAELARLVEAGEFVGHEILLVGFADAIGESDANTRLALARAEQVLDIMRTELAQNADALAGLKAVSFGELLPLSCNDTDEGRERNRRVEVWLRLPGSRSAIR